jgi:hypothetical protein
MLLHVVVITWVCAIADSARLQSAYRPSRGRLVGVVCGRRLGTNRWLPVAPARSGGRKAIVVVDSSVDVRGAGRAVSRQNDGPVIKPGRRHVVLFNYSASSGGGSLEARPNEASGGFVSVGRAARCGGGFRIGRVVDLFDQQDHANTNHTSVTTRARWLLCGTTNSGTRSRTGWPSVPAAEFHGKKGTSGMSRGLAASCVRQDRRT